MKFPKIWSLVSLLFLSQAVLANENIPICDSPEAVVGQPCVLLTPQAPPEVPQAPPQQYQQVPQQAPQYPPQQYQQVPQQVPQYPPQQYQQTQPVYQAPQPQQVAPQAAPQVYAPPVAAPAPAYTGDNERVSVYLHPVSLLTSILFNEFGRIWPINFYLTTEVPLDGHFSVMVSPSLRNGGFWRSGRDYFRVGSGIGVRRFGSGEANGAYMQVVPSLYYLKITTEQYVYGPGSGSSNPDPTTTTKHGMVGDLLFNFGFASKKKGSSLFIDIGIGYAWGLESDSNHGWLTSFGQNTGLAFDVNFGVGMPF